MENNNKRLKKLLKRLDAEGIKDEKQRNDFINLATGLWKEIDISAKYGFDVKQHWNDMMAYLEKEKAEEEKEEEIKKKKKEEFADKLAQAMVEGLNKQVLEEQSIKVPFIGWIKFEKPENEPYGDYGVYLINPTNKTFNKVEMFSGMFEGDIEGLLESSKVVKNLGILKPYSSIKINAIAWYDLDFVLWYHLDFYLNLNDKPECYCFDIMKIYAWKEEKIVELPILNIKGIPITLEPRDGEPITEEVKHTYLESRYTPNAE